MAGILDRTGVSIDIIRGREEADLIFSNFSIATLDRDRDYLYVDVGGGSTELTLIRRGERVEAKSFRIGSVRLLQSKVKPEVEEAMRGWCRALIERHGVQAPIVIGSGGNINRLYKLAGGVGKAPISRSDLEATFEALKQASHTDRLDRFGLKPDRVDVIVPACQIYLNAMALFGAGPSGAQGRIGGWRSFSSTGPKAEAQAATIEQAPAAAIPLATVGRRPLTEAVLFARIRGVGQGRGRPFVHGAFRDAIQRAVCGPSTSNR